MTLALAALVLRVSAGLIFVAQGVRKVFAPDDAPHGRGALADMIGREGLPQPDRLALIVAGTELIGGAALLTGFLTRIATIPLLVILIVAILGFKRKAGFLGGWDWPFSVAAIDLAILVLGPGPWSLDALLNLPI
jgi:putative oxidoreductase